MRVKESRSEGKGGKREGGREREREKLTLLFRKQSVIIQCNNYLTQSKSITILNISGEVYA